MNKLPQLRGTADVASHALKCYLTYMQISQHSKQMPGTWKIKALAVLALFFELLSCDGGNSKMSGSVTDVHTAKISGIVQDSVGNLGDGTVYLYARKQLANPLENDQNPLDSMPLVDGNFYFDSLLAGDYSMEVIQEGIRTGVTEGIELAEGEQRNIVIQITVVIQQNFYITNVDNSTTILNVILPGGTAQLDSLGQLKLRFAPDIADTVWAQVHRGDSTLWVPGILVQDSSGTFKLEWIDESGVQTLSSSSSIALPNSSSYSSLRTSSSSSSIAPFISSSTIVPSSSSSISVVPNGLCSTTADSTQGSFIDERDDQEYACFAFAGQIWMGENLRFNPSGSAQDWCYDGQSSNCNQGRYYDYSTAIANSLCPEGWHMPTMPEWVSFADSVSDRFALTGRVGGSWTGVAMILKTNHAAWTTSWGNNALGFNGNPTGLRNSAGIWSALVSSPVATYWTATEATTDQAMHFKLENASQNLIAVAVPKTEGHSVRCIQD